MSLRKSKLPKAFLAFLITLTCLPVSAEELAPAPNETNTPVITPSENPEMTPEVTPEVTPEPSPTDAPEASSDETESAQAEF